MFKCKNIYFILPATVQISTAVITLTIPFADTNKSEEVPDSSEDGPKKSTLTKVDSFVSYTEPGPIVRHLSILDLSWETVYRVLHIFSLFSEGRPCIYLPCIHSYTDCEGLLRLF